MPLVAAFDDVKRNRKEREAPTGGRAWRTNFIVPPEGVVDAPVAFLAEGTRERVIRPHYHQVDQFPMIVSGAACWAAIPCRCMPCISLGPTHPTDRSASRTMACASSPCAHTGIRRASGCSSASFAPSATTRRRDCPMKASRPGPAGKTRRRTGFAPIAQMRQAD